jgi:hypothetical protein
MVGCSCKAVLINSTVSGNEASREGGRVYSGGDSMGGGIYVSGELQLIHSTVSDNHAGKRGGGVYVLGRMDYMNSIIANNTGSGGNCITVMIPEGSGEVRIGTSISNLVEGGGCDAEFSGDPRLAPLADNGGATLTHALLPGSPAIDAAMDGTCHLSTDQRGEARPDGKDRLCDLGAYEAD